MARPAGAHRRSPRGRRRRERSGDAHVRARLPREALGWGPQRRERGLRRRRACRLDARQGPAARGLGDDGHVRRRARRRKPARGNRAVVGRQGRAPRQRPRHGLRRYEGKRGQCARRRPFGECVRGDDEQQDLPPDAGQGRGLRDARRHRQRLRARRRQVGRSLRRHRLGGQGRSRFAGQRVHGVLHDRRALRGLAGGRRSGDRLRGHERQGPSLSDRRRGPRDRALRLPWRRRARSGRGAGSNRLGSRQRGAERHIGRVVGVELVEAQHGRALARGSRGFGGVAVEAGQGVALAVRRPRAARTRHASRRLPLRLARGRRAWRALRGHGGGGARLHGRRRAPGGSRRRHRRATSRRDPRHGKDRVGRRQRPGDRAPCPVGRRA